MHNIYSYPMAEGNTIPEATVLMQFQCTEHFFLSFYLYLDVSKQFLHVCLNA